MKKMIIQAPQFFDLLKVRDVSMWQIFAQMVVGEEKELVFVDGEEKVLFNYILPSDSEQLEEDRKKFAAEYAEKISSLN